MFHLLLFEYNLSTFQMKDRDENPTNENCLQHRDFFMTKEVSSGESTTHFFILCYFIIRY